MTRRLEAETIDRLVAEYADGTTAAEVGRRYGVANSSVHQLVRQLDNRYDSPGSASVQTAQLIALVLAGVVAEGHCGTTR
jgi:transposase-like protein